MWFPEHWDAKQRLSHVQPELRLGILVRIYIVKDLLLKNVGMYYQKKPLKHTFEGGEEGCKCTPFAVDRATAASTRGGRQQQKGKVLR